MYAQHNFIEALETVLAWNLPDDLLPIAMSDQMRLLSGFEVEELWSDNFY